MEKDLHQISKTVEDIHELMAELVALQREHHQCCRAVTLPITSTEPNNERKLDSPASDGFKNLYDEGELMTIKEAAAFVPASRTKIYEWRNEGKLRTLERSSRDKRLIRAEVEAMRKWARDKGKG